MTELVAVIEVPTGSRNKYELDHETGAIWLDRRLFTSMQYPAEYGFLEGTLAEDGDPLDVLVAAQDPTFPGCHIAVRPIALMQMSDEKGPDAKILALPTWDTSFGWSDVADVPEQILDEIKHFFERYKDLEKGKFSKVDAWVDRAAAEREIAASRERFAAQK
ncbi:MAG: inorganic diphosphatase [Candidatus Dormibacteraceae bacterium]